MAYGKIKVDTLVYDNSGSDVEKTVSSLGTPEGTVVKSTTGGNEANTKFLRADGDGSCSWQVPPNTQLTLHDEDNFVSNDAAAAASQQSIKAYVDNQTLSLIDEDNMSTDSNSRPPSQQSVKAYVDAKVPTSITVADESSDTTCFPVFVTAATGDLAPKSGTNITFNSSTGLLETTAVTTTGNVIVGGDLWVSGTTTTINSATLTVDDKNIELGSVSTPTDTTADGGGITLKGATDKTITWIDATDRWTFNQNISISKAGQAISIIGSTDASGATLVFDGDSNGDATGGDYSFIEHGSDGDFSIHADNPNGDAQFELYVGSGSTIAVQAEAAGAVHLSHNGSQKLSTSAAGVTVTGSVSDSKGDVRKIIQNSQSSSYTLVAADSSKHVITDSAVTIPNSIFAAGDAVTIINNSGSAITLTKSITNLYLSTDGTNTNRTLAARGMATILFVSGTAAYISGAGLT